MIKRNPFRLLLNGRLKKNRLLVKLTAGILMPATIIILIIAVFFSIIYSNESMQDIKSTSYLTLSNTSYSLNSAFESSKQTAYQIYRNVVPLYYLNPTNEEKSRAIAYIKNVTISCPQLYSVYIMVDNKIVLDFGGSPLFEESSSDISELIKNAKNLRLNPRQIKNNNGMISLITTIYGKDPANDDAGDYVILNYKSDILMPQVNEEFLNPGQNLIISDIEGNILAHNDMGMFSRNISSEEYFKQVVDSGKDHGSINLTINNRYSVVNYLFTNNRNNLILFISDHSSFFSKIIKTRNTIIYFCLTLMILLMLVSLLVSYKIFTPINNVYSNIRNLLGNDAADRSVHNEEKYITGLISSFVERLNNLEEDNTRTFNSMKNAFLNNVLSSPTRIQQTDFEEGMKKYRLSLLTNSRYFMAIFRIDNYTSFLENNSKEAVSFQLSTIGSVVLEALGEYFECGSFSPSPDHIAVLAGVPASKEQFVPTAYTPVYKTIQDTILQLLSMTITIGLSEPLQDNNIKEFRIAYHQAYSATCYRLSLGKGLILRMKDIELRDDKNDRTSSIVDAIIGSVKAGSQEQFKADLHHLFSVIRVYNYEKFISILFYLAESIIKIPDNLPCSFAGTQDRDFEQIYTKIKSFEDFSEIEEWLLDISSETHSLLSELKSMKASDLFEAAVKYIHESYPMSSLSAAMMSDKLGITPQYFSKIFRQFTGMSFPDYISNLRLEKARELILSNPLMNLSAVCEKTGYNSASYFTKSFTKKYGLPPSKYALSFKEMG